MANRVKGFGIVQVVSGEHKGKVGYYDDVEKNGKAIIYPNHPLFREFIEVRKWNIRQPTPEQVTRYKLLCKTQEATMDTEREQAQIQIQRMAFMTSIDTESV
jgi:hypothetical protein